MCNSCELFLKIFYYKSIKRTRILDDILKEKEIKIEREKIQIKMQDVNSYKTVTQLF